MERVKSWLGAHQPDVLCLQELKAEEKDLPDFHALGYEIAHACQKTYNGVAILSRAPMTEVACGLGDDDSDVQQRLVAATVGGIRFVSVYVPNGQVVGSDKWTYKLAWLNRLRGYLERHHRPDQPLLLCGDFNVAPEPRDVKHPDRWASSVLFHPDARAALERVRSWGLTDVFRQHHAEPGFYSWWDYRMLSFPKNDGLRIDHVFVTEPLVRRVTDCWIDRDERKGKQPSDHAPVLATLA
jgi:exodeoxyribonuclease-3